MKLKVLKIFLGLVFAASNFALSQQIKLSEIGNASIKELLTGHKIEFIEKKSDSFWNGEVGLFGEKIDTTITTLYKPHYTVDWENESASPNIYYKSIPLKNPNFLTDVNGHLIIFTATIGNTEPIEVRELNVFDNEQIIDLKKNLIEEYGDFIDAEENTYRGNVYYWEQNNIIVRLSIENECLCKKAGIYRPNDYVGHPIGGRHGSLTVYFGVKPQSY